MYLLGRVLAHILQNLVGVCRNDCLVLLPAQLEARGRFGLADDVCAHGQLRRERFAVCVRGQLYGYAQLFIGYLEDRSLQPVVGLGITAAEDALEEVRRPIAFVQFDDPDLARYQLVDDGIPIVGGDTHGFGTRAAVYECNRICIFGNDVALRHGQFYKAVLSKRDVLMDLKISLGIRRTHINQRILR